MSSNKKYNQNFICRINTHKNQLNNSNKNNNNKSKKQKFFQIMMVSNFKVRAIIILR